MTRKLNIDGALVMAGLKSPKKKRKQESKPRKAYRREEDIIRTDIVKALRKKGIFVRRLEPSTRGKFGVSDLLVINKRRCLFTFVEVKSPTGQLSKDQIEFKNLCEICNIPYVVVRSVEQALEILT